MNVPNLVGELRMVFHRGGAVLHGPRGVHAEVALEATEYALREWTRNDGLGRYRPLSGARTLRRGRTVNIETNGALSVEAAMDIVYPLALEHIAQHAAGTLRIVTLEETLARQGGRYAVARELSVEGRVIARDLLCTRCVRLPVWDAETQLTAGAIPCPEACSVMVSLCREVALWEASPPASAITDPAVAWAAFETEGNEIREAYPRDG